LGTDCGEKKCEHRLREIRPLSSGTDHLNGGAQREKISNGRERFQRFSGGFAIERNRCSGIFEGFEF
jgi:hypothetical protein